VSRNDLRGYVWDTGPPATGSATPRPALRDRPTDTGLPDRLRLAPPAIVRDDGLRMSDERPSEVLGGLPRTRPHRRSEKRVTPPKAAAAKPEQMPPAKRPTAPVRPARAARTPTAAPGSTKLATPSAPRARQPAQPPGTPAPNTRGRPAPAGRGDLIGSAVQMTAELAEIGISAGARALKGVVARLPRP